MMKRKTEVGFIFKNAPRVALARNLKRHSNRSRDKKRRRDRKLAAEDERRLGRRRAKRSKGRSKVGQ